MKQEDFKTLKKELDKVFSRYIRLKETYFVGLRRMGKCVTCGKLLPFENLDCGHFISREYLIFRWAEVNAHIQCRYCNRFLAGNKKRYRDFMIQQYGKEFVKQMQKQKHEPFRPDKEWLLEKIKKYKLKVKRLEDK